MIERSDEATTAPSDTPIPDRIWDGLVAWMSGTFAVVGAALAISATLGWPRRTAAALTGAQLAVLVLQAFACSGFVVRSGRSLSRSYPGALLVAFTAGVPAALAALMGMEWLHPGDPVATWGRLLVGSVRLAALEAVPVGYLLWILRERPFGWKGVETSEAG